MTCCTCYTLEARALRMNRDLLNEREVDNAAD